MSKTRNALVTVGIALGFLLLIPVVGEILAPMQTSEMMGGRMMVWGLFWLLLVFLAILVLLSIAGIAAWRRLHR